MKNDNGNKIYISDITVENLLRSLKDVGEVSTTDLTVEAIVKSLQEEVYREKIVMDVSTSDDELVDGTEETLVDFFGTLLEVQLYDLYKNDFHIEMVRYITENSDRQCIILNYLYRFKYNLSTLGVTNSKLLLDVSSIMNFFDNQAAITSQLFEKRSTRLLWDEIGEKALSENLWLTLICSIRINIEKALFKYNKIKAGE